MVTTQAVADRALALAQAFLDAYRGELAELAHGQRDILIGAQARVRTTNVASPETERMTPHVAFALLAAAYQEAVRQR